MQALARPLTEILLDKQIIKDGKVVVDEWQLLTDYDNAATVKVPATATIVALDIWQTQKSLLSRSNIGVWINNDIDLAAIAADILKLPVIAINFPTFMDGRGFSLARLLRERYNYKGEIRAIGHVIRDQLCYLKRSGFNAFSLSETTDLNAATDSLDDFTEAYQTSVDMPLPLFRRRA